MKKIITILIFSLSFSLSAQDFIFSNMKAKIDGVEKYSVETTTRIYLNVDTGKLYVYQGDLDVKVFHIFGGKVEKGATRGGTGYTLVKAYTEKNELVLLQNVSGTEFRIIYIDIPFTVIYY